MLSSLSFKLRLRIRNIKDFMKHVKESASSGDALVRVDEMPVSVKARIFTNLSINLIQSARMYSGPTGLQITKKESKEDLKSK